VGPKLKLMYSSVLTIATDASVRRENARGDDGAVALLLDSRVPVVMRRGGRFALDLLEPRVFAWRLIEMGRG
jgi:hypothetical protein